MQRRKEGKEGPTETDVSPVRAGEHRRALRSGSSLEVWRWGRRQQGPGWASECGSHSGLPPVPSVGLSPLLPLGPSREKPGLDLPPEWEELFQGHCQWSPCQHLGEKHQGGVCGEDPGHIRISHLRQEVHANTLLIHAVPHTHILHTL